MSTKQGMDILGSLATLGQDQRRKDQDSLVFVDEDNILVIDAGDIENFLRCIDRLRKELEDHGISTGRPI